jgi:antibiotic biosynthesis monooxygenase (ABM) superfamily enzyme
MSGPRTFGGASSGNPGAVTIVIQTGVRQDAAEAFVRWQDETSRVIATFPDFLEQKVIPPSPPTQVDWVILQRFANAAAATAWLKSAERLKRLTAAAPMLVGRDDVHLVKDGDAGALPSPVSVVISTRIKPGQEEAYHRWEQRIALAQSRALGFQGYRFEPPTPGVQDDWLAILRFDTEANLQAWLDSPERNQLLQEASGFIEDVHARIVRTGFDQWFRTAQDGTPPPAAWKQNMLVLLMLYPVVFLFGTFVQTPLLGERLGLSFPIALFISNVVSVILLNYLVPRTTIGFTWWLRPTGAKSGRTELAGTILIVALYGALLFAFSKLF